MNRPSPRGLIARTVTLTVLTLPLAGCVTFEGSASSASSTRSSAPSASSNAAQSNASGSSSSSSTSASDEALPSARELVDAAQDTLEAAKSFTDHQEITEGGVTYTVTTRGAVDGSALEQKSEHPKEGIATYRAVGGELYIEGDRTFWSGDAYAQSHFVDTWVRAAAGKAKSDTVKDMGLRSTVDEFTDDDTFMEPYRSSDAYVMRDTLEGVGETYCVHAGDGTMLWITADGTKQIVKISGIEFEDGSKGTEYLSDYDAPYTDIMKPSDAVDMPADSGDANTTT